MTMTTVVLDDWRADAACRPHHALFVGALRSAADRAEAKAVCDACPVFGPCYELATTVWQAGFQAGMTEKERAVAFLVADPIGSTTDVLVAARAAGYRAPRVCACGQPAPTGRGIARCDACIDPRRHRRDRFRVVKLDRPEPEPDGRFCARDLDYRVPAHACASDGCACGRNSDQREAVA